LRVHTVIGTLDLYDGFCSAKLVSRPIEAEVLVEVKVKLK
jgi:hypothetical protein